MRHNTLLVAGLITVACLGWTRPAPVVEVLVAQQHTVVLVPSPFYRIDPATGTETEGVRLHRVRLDRFVDMREGGHWTGADGVTREVLTLVVDGDFQTITLLPDKDWAQAWSNLNDVNPGGVVSLAEWLP